MRRNLVLSLLSFFIISVSYAGPVSLDKAKKIAENVLGKNSSDKKVVSELKFSAQAKNRFNMNADSPAFYIFNSVDSLGFVIVSGEDRLPSVFAYSGDGFIGEGADMPGGLSLYLEAYSRYVEEVRSGKTEPIMRSADDTVADTVVGPLLKSKWGQGEPFNMYVPNSYPVGCVATAMAQIMFYYKWPNQGMENMRYEWNGKFIEENFAEHTYDWSVMKNTTNANRMGKARDAVARISYDCGVATQMQYGEGGSGTHDDLAYVAYYKYFDYDASILDFKRQISCNSQEEWENLIYDELDKKRPIQFSAHDESDGGGHSFVVDGYDTNGFVHVNWGWDGMGDGFFDLKLMDVMDYIFNLDQSAIIGIVPDKDDEASKRKQYRLCMFGVPEVKEGYSPSVDEEFYMSLGGIYNYSASTRVFNLGMGLFDKQGNLLDDVSVFSLSQNQLILQGFYGREYGNIKCKLPREYPDGDYVFRVISKENGYDEWLLVETAGGDLLNQIPAYIHDGKIFFNEFSTGIDKVENDEVLSVERYDLNGRKIDDDSFISKGVVLERRIFRNGKVKVVKICY